MPQLVLASQSPRRAELLRLLELPFEVWAADVQEAPRAGETPSQLVTRLSRAKADGARPFDRLRAGSCDNLGAGLVRPPATVVIGCDTVVALDGQILGKPRDAADAAAILRRLRGRPHDVYSAVTCLGPDGRASTRLARTRVVMRAYSDAEIASYVGTGDPLDKAGGYAIQHDGFRPVDSVEGCYASVMGLPLCHLAQCLASWGVEAAADVPIACQEHTGHRCTVYREILTP